MDEIERDMQTERSRMEMGGAEEAASLLARAARVAAVDADKVQKRDMSPVEFQITRLENALNDLESVIGAFETRLAVILSPLPDIVEEPPEFREASVPATEMPQSQLANAAASYASHVAWMADRLRRLNDRIEL